MEGLIRFFVERHLLVHVMVAIVVTLGIVQAAFESIGEPKSGSDVRRLIQQGSVQLDGAKLTDPKTRLPDDVGGKVLRLDKRHSVVLR